MDLAKAAEVLLLLLPGGSNAAVVDDAGSTNLAILRALGIPTSLAVVSSSSSNSQQQQQQQHGQADGVSEADMMVDDDEPCAAATAGAGGAAAAAAKSSSTSLKQRSAAKKRAEKALQQHLPGDIKLLAADTQQDMQQLLRCLADSTPQLPVWRRQRPYLMVQQAAFVPQQQQQQQQDLNGVAGGVGELLLTGYIRAQGLSANQLVTVPGAGDFRIARVEGLQEPAAAGQQQQQRKGAATAAAAAAGGSSEVDMADVGERVLAVPDPEQQEGLIRENEADPLAGEWPFRCFFYVACG